MKESIIKRHITISISARLHAELKILCIRRCQTLQRIIEEFIRKEVEKEIINEK